MDQIKSEKELLEQLLENDRKRTLYEKVTAVSSAGIFAAVILCLIFLLPGLLTAVKQVDTAAVAAQSIMGEAETALLQAENAVSGFSDMSASLSETSESVNRFVTDNSTALSDTVKQLGSIDYEGLNKAIRDLQDAVEPFARLVNRFK